MQKFKDIQPLIHDDVSLYIISPNGDFQTVYKGDVHSVPTIFADYVVKSIGASSSDCMLNIRIER